MPTIEVDMSGFDGSRKALHNLASQINNPGEKLMRRLGESSLDDVDQRFMTRGYNTWAPDSESTIKKKGHGMVLIDSGVMYASAKMSKMTQNEVEIDVPVGGKKHDPMVPIYHQKGTKRMPQRKIIEVTPRLEKSLTDTLQKWVEDMIMAFGKAM